tara:strand:- start:144 stop:446 length:303 start_codon:yes stop_codon:yes gene_type:complete
LLLFFINALINRANKNRIGITPKNTIKDRSDECGSKKESGLLMTTSPYNCPKFKGPEPTRSSIKVGLYLEKNNPHISDLLRKNARTLNKENNPENKDLLS